METVGLVACVGMKRPVASEARDLYVSPWFVKARRFVERRADRWFILSAEHGLLEPTRVVAPYEKTLNRMGVADRRRWATGVLVDLRRQLQPRSRIVMLAGSKYREHLMAGLRADGHTVEVPMEGLRIGHQLQWLSRA